MRTPPRDEARAILDPNGPPVLSLPLYPADLEAWWVERARRAVGHREPASAVASLAPEAARLSDGFTTERQQGFAGYADDERRLFAYGLFFFPRSFVRTQMVLAECRARRATPRRPARLRLLDVGAGTGAAGLAAADLLIASGETSGVELTAVDPSATSLGLLRQLHADHAAGRFAHCELRTVPATVETLPDLGEGFDLVLLSLVLNEAAEHRAGADPAGWIRDLLGRLRPGGLLVIMEPGTQEAAQRLHRLRDTLLAEDAASVVAPCLHRASCPMLGLRGAWCHEVRSWNVPPAARRIAQRLRRDAGFLRFTFLALTAHDPARPAAGGPDRARLVAPVRPLKGLMLTVGCAADGALHTYEWLTRGTSGTGRKALRAIERGDVIAWHDLAPVGDTGRLRTAALTRETGFRS